MTRPAAKRLCAGVLALLAQSAGASQAVTLLPSQDTPIYADDGLTTSTFATHSNGAGETLFVGTNGTGSARRSLIRFDLSVLPLGTVVSKARLTLFCDRQPDSEYETMVLHRVTEAWTTGASNSDALGTPGQGGQAEPGDSTWYYRSWPGPNSPDGLKWSQPGAAFDPAIIASQQVGPLSVGGDPNSVYVWSGKAMIANLNDWLADPASNFGWIMTGNETQTRSVKRFISSEGRVNNWLKPNLILTVDIPEGAPATLSLASSANPADFAQSFDITATVFGGSSPTGTVSFREGGAPIGGCVDLPLKGGQAVCRVKKLPTGSYAITARYSGDRANPGIESKVLAQSVDEPKTYDDNTTWTVVASSASPSAPGEAVTFTASIRGGLGPAGAVSFLDGSNVLCNGVVLSHRKAVCTTARLSRGKHRIAALYSGDGTNYASSSSPITQLVQPDSSVCTAASRPVLDPVAEVWQVHAGEELRLTVTASDCMGRAVAIAATRLPASASFIQAYVAASGKQQGVLAWTPGLADVERIRRMRFSAGVATAAGGKSSAAQVARITVLPPLPTGEADPVADAAAARLSIGSAAWSAGSRLVLRGRIRWKPGASRLVRAAAIAEPVRLTDAATGAVLGEAQARLSGSWQAVIALPGGSSPPAHITATFRMTTSAAKAVRTGG